MSRVKSNVNGIWLLSVSMRWFMLKIVNDVQDVLSQQ